MIVMVFEIWFISYEVIGSEVMSFFLSVILKKVS